MTHATNQFVKKALMLILACACHSGSKKKSRVRFGKNMQWLVKKQKKQYLSSEVLNNAC